MAAQMESLGEYNNVYLPPSELGVEAMDTSRVENSGFGHITDEQNLRNLEASTYIDVNVTETATAVSELETSFLDVKLTTEETVGVLDTSNDVALIATRGETHMFLNSTPNRRESNCGCDWLSVDTPGDAHAINAKHMFLSSGIQETIKENWLNIGPDDQPITKLTLKSYRIDNSKADDEFIGFYFFRVYAGSFYLYCMVGLCRDEHNTPDLRKLSSKESDICL